MDGLQSIKNFCVSHKKILVPVVAAILCLAFVGSLVWAVFGGGEFAPEQKDNQVKGLLSLDSAYYRTDYLSGENFVFDKQNARVRLIAKDPTREKIINIDDLPADQYGFLVNGEGEMILDGASIVMDSSVKTIAVASTVYPTVRVSLSVTVVSFDQADFVSTLTVEAENAELYDAAGKIVSFEQKKTLPNENKPYVSSEGTDKTGLSCSGGACLRNLTQGMQVRFSFVCNADVEVDFSVLTCKRPSNASFDGGYSIDVNGEAYFTKATVPGDTDGGYFVPYKIEGLRLTLKKGINVITFTCKQKPCNLDGIQLSAVDGAKIFAQVSLAE